MGIGTGRDSGNVGGGGGDSRSGAEPSTAQENTMAAGIGDGRRDVGGEERGDRGGGEGSGLRAIGGYVALWLTYTSKGVGDTNITNFS